MKLILTTVNDKFVIETEKNIEAIYIKKKEIVYFEKHDRVFTLDAKKICQLLKHNNEDRIQIFYIASNDTPAEEFVIGETTQLIVKGNLNIQVNHHMISLYVTMGNYLRFISNQLPSAASYFDSSILKRLSINNEHIQIEIECISKVLPVDDALLLIKNRKSMENISISPINSNIEHKHDLFYWNVCYEISVSMIVSLLDHVDFDNFDATVLDTFIEPTFRFSDTTTRQFKILYSSLVEEELWFSLKEYHLLIKSYGTLHSNNLAFRTSFLPNESYQYYQKLKKEGFNQREKGNRKIVLISEYPHKAQDNGLHLFHYLNNEQDSQLDCYYVITENSKDFNNLLPFSDKIVIFKSKKHFDLITKADMILHTHSSNYALPLITKFMEQYYVGIKKIFLQHGIIGVRNLDYLYGKKTNPNFTDKFIVSSDREKSIVEKELHYSPKDILLTGLARFDTLLEGNSEELSYALRKNVLLMPSWRQGLDHLTDNEFVKTDFFIEMDSLLRDKSFESIAKKNSLNISFYLHTNFQKFNHLFHSDFVSIISEKDSNVQKLLKSNGVLITDFSSVGLDFSLLNRSVIYYTFDGSLKESRDKAKHFLPGPIIKSRKKLLKVLKNKIIKNELSWKYKRNRKKNIYVYEDVFARYRIFEQIMLFLDNK